jgi:hypothetical protein
MQSTWAIGFYMDDSLQFAEIAFRTQPIRFWLVMFKKDGTDEMFHAVVMPDGTMM